MSISKLSNLVDLLRYRSLHQPDQKAFIFLRNGEIQAGSLTYQELDQQARAIAVHLEKLGTSGERALLLYPTGLEFIKAFFGCLYAGIVAIPVPMPDAVRIKRVFPRLELLVKDAQAKFVLTQSQNYSQLKETSFQSLIEFWALDWIISDQIPSQLAQEWQQSELGGESLAYLQYTSGSTSTPKGVMVTHGNLMHHCGYLQQAWGYTPNSISATWVPHFHDYGLVDGLLQPLYIGIKCYLMSPVAFLQKPIRWL
ncbi:MAG: AMP-binding protein, partial [Bacteroidota bacterium]